MHVHLEIKFSCRVGMIIQADFTDENTEVQSD